MKSSATIDFARPAKLLGLANAPGFLLRELRADNTALSVASSMSTHEILTALRKSVAHEPATLEDAAKSYVYLVALSLKDPEVVTEASELDAPYLPWFKRMASALVDRQKSAANQSLTMPDISLVRLPHPTASANTIAVFPNEPVVEKSRGRRAK